MDGSNRQVFVTGVDANSLALDYEANDLYWADHNTGNIECISLNGGGKRIVSAQGSAGQHSAGISLSGGRVYWTSHHPTTAQTLSAPTAPPSTNYDSGSGCMTTNDAGMTCRTCSDGMTTTRRCQSGWVSEDPLPFYNGYTYGNVDQLGQLVPYQRHFVQASGYQQYEVRAAIRATCKKVQQFGPPDFKGSCMNTTQSYPTLRISKHLE
ncbi:hypothetical protein BV898_14108 [Hypsibius exemplaris]|uniref:DUF5050 domain-containing protein n=1 Tax=Hypsibius exemplaris TaxID=2072580 RepID=A0A1W0W8W2_HYPEX|nr:hypothetical protein BV898_14108 [Hypsibius exemplaris]